MSEEVRWKYRFRNFSRAYALLREALESEVEDLSQLEREGVIQRFEFTFELAWNTLKDRLEYDGMIVGTVSTEHMIELASQARLIDDGDAWIEMLTERNLLTHTYEAVRFKTVARKVRSRYLAILSAFHGRLAVEALSP